MRSAKAVISEKFARLGSSTSVMSYSATNPQRSPSHTLTSLKRWSVATKELPGERAVWTHQRGLWTLPREMKLTVVLGSAVSQIKAIHVYDFDNTCEDHPVSHHPTR